MAIIAAQTVRNGAIGNYWRILKMEFQCSPEEPVERMFIVVGFYASEAARHNEPGLPMWTQTIPCTVDEMAALGLEDPRKGGYQMLLNSQLFMGTNATGDVPVE